MQKLNDRAHRLVAARSAAQGPPRQLMVSRRWVNEHLGAVDASRLIIVDVKGDSMMPSINDGDVIVVDTTVCEVDRSGAVYLILQSDKGLRVKRLERHAAGPIMIVSENPRYFPEMVMGSFSQLVTILGRVLWWGSESQLTQESEARTSFAQRA